ncbi:hypothetical protein [Roseibium suaedae]|uniref:Uncharacterized protein n=1 Tax=Roseibium suaedae TaxID=735517 RepID=A0A1M7N4U6_9HYPH|nr:hypothetical protein [Roseibium suaedae]SHM98609.1 hypothetical protein SAMN05444272_3707 [Roseibium suaedae]
METSPYKRILIEALHFPLDNLNVLLRTCGAWYIIWVICYFVSLLFIQRMILIGRDIPGMLEFGLNVRTVFDIAFNFVSSASIGLAWHRFALAGEVPNKIHLRFGKLEFRFMMNLLVLAFILVVSLCLLVAAASEIGALLQAPAISFTFFGAVFLFLASHAIRSYLVLPAISLKQLLKLGDAHKLGKDLGWPMLGALLSLTVPIILSGACLDLLGPPSTKILPVALVEFKILLLGLMLQMLIKILFFSVITAGYRLALERQNQGSV